MVLIENANNPADGPDFGHNDPDQVYGAVAYNYYIGTYEVTNAQYAIFLNIVAKYGDPYELFHTGDQGMAITRSGNETDGYTYTTDFPNGPVRAVSFWSAARFTNWLTTGDTERGVYDFKSVVDPVNTSVVRDLNGLSGLVYALPTEDEWYKAAYYAADKDGQGTEGYFRFPHGSDSAPGWDQDGYTSGSHDVGVFSPNQNGTYDQGGNMWEWNEGIFNEGERSVRGGGTFFADYTEFYEGASVGFPSDVRNHFTPDSETYVGVGFRIVGVYAAAVPEPSTYATLGGLAMLGVTLLFRRRNARGTEKAS